MDDTITVIYCERLGPGLLAEPFNAVSNGSFLIAAWAAWTLARGTGGLSAGLRVLIALAASVGIGSGLWHTLATPWAIRAVAAVLPSEIRLRRGRRISPPRRNM